MGVSVVEMVEKNGQDILLERKYNHKSYLWAGTNKVNGTRLERGH